MDRICFITTGTRYGHHHYLMNLLEGMRDSSDEPLDVNIFFLQGSPGMKDDFPEFVTAYPIVSYAYDSTFRDILITLLGHIRFLYLLSTTDVVVHINTPIRSQLYTLSLTILSRVLRSPVLRTVHEITKERLTEVSNRTKWIAYKQISFSSHVIVHSKSTEAHLRSKKIKTPVTVLPHGNYLSFRDAQSSSTLPLPTDGNPVIVFFAPHHYKGFDVFVESLEGIDESFTVWIIGSVDESAIESLTKLQTRRNVYKEAKYIPSEDLGMYFEYADITVLPYRQGTTSGALHLALAFETAVVTSDLPCFTEVIDDGVQGLIMEEYSAEELQSKLRVLLASPTYRKELAKNGLELESSAKYDWSRIGAETIAIYRSV